MFFSIRGLLILGIIGLGIVSEFVLFRVAGFGQISATILAISIILGFSLAGAYNASKESGLSEYIEETKPDTKRAQ